MKNKILDYEFLIMDYLKSYRLYHSYQETIFMMKKIINKEHIPIFTEDLKNIDKEILSAELSRIVLSQINSDIEKKQDLTELIPDIEKSMKENSKPRKMKLKKKALIGVITATSILTAINISPNDKNSSNTSKPVNVVKKLEFAPEEFLKLDSKILTINKETLKISINKSESMKQKKDHAKSNKKQILSNLKKCKNLEDVLERKKQLKALNLTDEDKIYKDCKLSAPLQRFMYEQSIIHEVPVDFIFSIVYTETRGKFNSNGEKSYNAPGNYDLGLTQQNTKSSVKSFSEKYKIDFDEAKSLILNDPYVNVASFFLEIDEIKAHLNNKFDRRDFAGHYNDWCNWQDNSISREYVEINDKAYNKIYTKYHKIIKK